MLSTMLRMNGNSVVGKQLFVRGFPHDVSDEKIQKFFAKNGITLAQIQRVKGKQ